MSVDELAVMDGGKCICQVRGVRPFHSYKYDITNHKNYDKISDSGKTKPFEISALLSQEVNFQKKDMVDCHTCAVSKEEEMLGANTL